MKTAKCRRCRMLWWDRDGGGSGGGGWCSFGDGEKKGATRRVERVD